MNGQIRENEGNGRAKLDGSDISIDNGFIRWHENFWYYHKWHLLIALFVVFVIILCITQMTGNEKSDTAILMGGPYYPNTEMRNNMYAAFEEVLPEDYNEDGEKSVEIVHYEIYSTEQFKAIDSVDKNSSLNASNLQSFSNLMQVGEFSVCIIDMWLYEDIADAGGIRPLSELFGDNIPEGAIDEYAIDFKSTEFAKHFTVFEKFPDTTVICLRNIGFMNSFFNKGASEEEYKISEDLFKAIVEYKPEA